MHNEQSIADKWALEYVLHVPRIRDMVDRGVFKSPQPLNNGICCAVSAQLRADLKARGMNTDHEMSELEKYEWHAARDELRMILVEVAMRFRRKHSSQEYENKHIHGYPLRVDLPQPNPDGSNMLRTSNNGKEICMNFDQQHPVDQYEWIGEFCDEDGQLVNPSNFTDFEINFAAKFIELRKEFQTMVMDAINSTRNVSLNE